MKALLFAACPVALLLAACGDPADSSLPDGGEPAGSARTDEAVPAPAPSAAPTPAGEATAASDTPQPAPTSSSQPTRAVTGERQVNCLIANDNATMLQAPCLFVPQSNGGFSLMRPRGDERPLYDQVVSVSVAKTARTTAEVRGLTTNGNSSRWGEATRSTSDPACWVGSDFRVCAYQP